MLKNKKKILHSEIMDNGLDNDMVDFVLNKNSFILKKRLY